MTRRTRVWLLLLLLSGLMVLSYPSISDYVNRKNSSWAISQAQDALLKAEPETLQQQRRLAQAYNRTLLQGKQEDTYWDILNIADGVMGYIQIPDIHIKLPVYHGVDEAVLEKGAGHLPESAFPIGGEGNHAVITGHTGLPDAKLFTDLTELAVDDLFYIHILDEVLTYRVDSIHVVLPEETDRLQPEPGKDYCTLVTCTPYGINSHRLLVRGTRIFPQEAAVSAATAEDTEVPMPPGLIVAMVLAGGLILWIFLTVFIRKKE